MQNAIRVVFTESPQVSADVDWDWLPCSIRAASASFSKCFGSAKKATKSIVVRAESIRILGVLHVLGVCGKSQKVCVRRVCERIANLFLRMPLIFVDSQKVILPATSEDAPRRMMCLMTSAMNDLSMKNEVHNTNKKEKKGKSTVHEMVKKKTYNAAAEAKKLQSV